MSVKTGVFTKYVVAFADPKLTVSNDPGAGDVIVDADITVTMSRWTDGTTFKITLYDLPQSKATDLQKAQKPGSYPALTIKLGYFETAVQLVVDGIYEKVESKQGADNSPGQNRQVTTITGREAALLACDQAGFTGSLDDDQASSYTTAARHVLAAIASDDNKNKHPGIDKVAGNTVALIATALPAQRSPSRFHNNKVLTVLDEIAGMAQAELLIADKMVFLDKPIKRGDIAPAALDPATNLAKFESKTAKVGGSPGAEDAGTAVPYFTFTALGDPTLRPGQKITVSGVSNFSSAQEYRIRSVEHQFSASTGYVCVGAAAAPLADGALGRGLDSLIKQNASSAAQDVAGAIKAEAGKNPAIEVAAVKAAADNAKYPYQVDLYYGQPQGVEPQPSIEVAIAAQDDHVYLHRPIASPFAWRKCGLVTPVYPTMKALVAHSRGAAGDAIVNGYLWSKQPDFPPPPNHPGDWWLSLPIDLDATALPADQTKLKTIDDWAKVDWKKFDQTKAANDLTGQSGKRVIEVKGLKITIGAGKLAALGTRPNEGPDDDFLIEHATGTSVHIDANGALTIDVGQAPLTIKGSVVIEGSLEIK